MSHEVGLSLKTLVDFLSHFAGLFKPSFFQAPKCRFSRKCDGHASREAATDAYVS